MHPVTAHGFNFGLLGVDALVKEIEVALRRGEDIGNPMLLQRYERKQRRSTVPLFWMTRLIVEIYTRESPPAKLVRQVLLKLGNQVTPFKRSIARSLSGIA
jgi:2-polyprenyl-6-methoxyphenol hydroxylase-like FAD-dependent oxidoreductase